MPRRLHAGAVALWLGLSLASACSEEKPPITIDDHAITIDNQSRVEWRNVLVTVNDHYRGGAQSLAPGGRLTAPLGQFQTGYGQRFPWERTRVVKVEVTATDANGEAVRLQWGRSPERYE